jgi:glycosyltransferase involved in cell wall biosynthesis
MSGGLYLCYFGLREPLVQTQVLPYLRELAGGGERMALLTFEREPWSGGLQASERARLRADGISWHSLPYHKAVPGKLLDIARGAMRAASIARAEGLDVLHGRSHVGAMIGALAKRRARAKLIFDIRGFLAEEYADSGNWREGGLLFRATKRAERWLMRAADGFVVLTENAKRTLFPSGTGGRAIEVIPTCVDPARFEAPRPHDRFVFVYAGSLGGYYLTRETAEFLAAARAIDPSVYALVLTQSDAALLVGELERVGFTRDDYRLVNAAPEDVPRWLAEADAGLAIIRPSYARRAMSPTKVAEYLAAGLPVVATAGIGDLDALRNVILLHGNAYAEAFRALQELRRDPELAERCREEARSKYDMASVGGARYRRLYAGLRGLEVSGSRGPARPATPQPRNLATRIKVLALASYPVEAPSSRFRIVQFIAPLAERGIDVDFSPFLNARLFAVLYEPAKLLARLPLLVLRAVARIRVAFRRADVVFVQREAMLMGPPVVERLASRRRPMILDLDDATWIAYPSPTYGRLATLLKWPRKTDVLIRRSRAVTCGSPKIAEHVAARGGEAVLLPTIIDTRLYTPREPAPRDVPVVGWIGTHGTYAYLERLLPIFEELRRELRFELMIVGSGRPIDARPWSLDREPEDFRSLDVGVYPIDEGEWSAAKSGFKAIQYMASAVPFVMSPVGVCATIGQTGVTHFNAVTDDHWREALRRLIGDAELRARMGRAGRAYAERHYSIDAYADTLAAVIRSAIR